MKDRNADLIWKALADPMRRQLLDVLQEQPRTTGELCAQFAEVSRTNVMKHLDVLEQAGLVVVQRQGRQRWNYLDPQPLQEVCEPWLDRHVRDLAAALLRLKQLVERNEKPSLED